MINLYNANTEKEQTEVLSNLFALLQTFDINPTKHIIMAGDFNLFFNSNLVVAGGNPTLKRKSLPKLIELKEAYDLCNTWRVRNTKVKQFTFTQQHSSGFIQRRLDFFFYLEWSSRICIDYRYSDSYFNRSLPSDLLLFTVKGFGNSIAP